MNADLMRNNHTQRFQEPLNFLRAIRYQSTGNSFQTS